MDAIILAAGNGTRMAPLCTQLPKPMLPLDGKPILVHLLERCVEAGVQRAFVVVEYLADFVEHNLHAPLGIDLVFVRQGPPKGTGHAVAQVAPLVPGDALLLMGDSLVSSDTLRALVASSGVVVAAARVEDARAYGVLEVEGNQICALHEKPAEPPSDLVNTGFYRLPADAIQASLDLQASPRGEFEVTDLIHAAALGGQASWIEATDWVDVGNPWQYLAAHETMLSLSHQVPVGEHGGPGLVEDGVVVRGRLWVDDGAVVKSGTYVEGDVRVGPGAIVGPHAYLRGPIDVGAGCKVGAFTEIKNSILMAGAKAPHHNYVGDSVLGHNCNLGSGTKLANVKHGQRTVRVDWHGKLLDTGRRKFGSIIGDGAKTGVNASLNPGTVLAPHAQVGAGAAVGGWIDRDA